MTPTGSVVDVYLNYEPDFSHLEGEEPRDDDHQLAWDDFKECLTEVLKTRFTSLSEPDKERWLDRECRVILENRHGCVTVSEYCGCVAVSLVPDDDYRNQHPEISKAWCEQIETGFREAVEKAFPNWAMRKIGTFSNGEAVYQKTA